MYDSLSNPRKRNEAGFGLMEVVIGVFGDHRRHRVFEQWRNDLMRAEAGAPQRVLLPGPERGGRHLPAKSVGFVVV